MGRYLPLVLKNVLRNRRRSLLTISSMALSLCLLGVIMAIYFALYLSDTPPSQALRLYSRNRISITLPFPTFYLERVLRTGGVKDAMPFQWYGGVYKDARDPNNFFSRFGVDPKKLWTIYPEMLAPEEQKQAFITERRATAVGSKLARKFGWKLGDKIVLQGDIYPGDLELFVRCIYENPLDDESMYFHWEYIRESLPEGRKDALSALAILAQTPDDVPRLISAVDEQFRNSPVQMRTETERAFALGFLNMIGNVKAILASVCLAVTFTILLVSANTIAMSVRERVREVGILKTLGFQPGAILGMVLAESVVIAVAGATVGYLLAQGLCGIVRQGPAFTSEIKTLSVQPQVALVMLTAAVTIAVVSSAVPAWSASRVHILEALRRTD